MVKAVFPGSFDPLTLGHLDVVERASAHVDELVVLVTGNPNKPSGLFLVERREELAKEALRTADLRCPVTVDHWGGLLVDYTSANDIGLIVKGLRSSLDYEYEWPMAQLNRRLSGVDTAFYVTDERYAKVSSSLVKEIARFGGDVAEFLPAPIAAAVAEAAGS